MFPNERNAVASRNATQEAPQTPLEVLQAILLNDPKDRIITGDEVSFNSDPNDKAIHLPQGFGFTFAIDVLQRKQKEQEEPTQFERRYDYRPHDGAFATTQVLKSMYGLVLAKGIPTMFGTRPAETIDVQVGVGKRVTCFWGLIEIPSLDGSKVFLSAFNDRVKGPVFCLSFGGPRKHKAEVERLFDAIDQYLRTHSIYRGKALAGADELEFWDRSWFRREEVVFADVVEEMLLNLLYGPIRNTATYRKLRIPRKRALLLHGDFGTGKTSVGVIASQEAEQHGWTFITARPGDDIRKVLRTAKLYQPAVVLVEDVETVAAANGRQVSELLDAFDGATAKGGEVIMILTTNHIEQITKGLLRPGRIDATIEFGALDRNGVERLIRAVVPVEKLGEVDFDQVYEQMDRFLPAFVRSAVDRATGWAVNREGENFRLSTADLAGAAMSLHDQLGHMQEAQEIQPQPQLQLALEELIGGQITDAVNRTRILDYDDDPNGRLAITAG